MDAYEATRIVFSRVQALDPDNAAKIMGLLLIQDHGEKEMIRLAFGPETLLHSLILNARKDLGLLPPSAPSTPSTSPSPSPFSLSCQNSRDPNSPSSWAPPPLPFSRTNDDGDGEEYLLQEHLSFLNEQAAAAGDPVYGMGGGGGWEQRSCLSPDGSGWKPCLYFARDFCKNGSSCSFLRGPADGMSAVAAATAAAVEQQCQELILMRTKSPRLAASAAAAFPYSPSGSSSGKCLNFMLQQQQNESQRAAAAAAAAAALMLENENHKFMGRPRMDRGDFAGMVNPGSRQIYLTFPADSTFREEDVSNYFSIYGPVQDVRIPYQQKRMFGFVTFVYPETVKLILAKGNPHFVCDARVLVKPYREKGKVPDKYRKQQQGERIDFSGCATPTGLDSRDLYDLQQLASARMVYGSNGQDVLLRRKMEEQQAAAELQQAIEMQRRRFMGLQLLDIKNRNLASPTAPILSPLATPASTTFSASVFSDGSSSNGSQDEAVAVEEKRLNPAASDSASAAAAAADTQQTAVNSEERASAETAPNEDISYQESAEHNLPDSPFASPTKKSSFVNGSFSLASEENSSLTGNGSSISNSNGHLIASTLLAPSSPLENMASFKSSCFFQMPRFSSGHGAVGL